MEKAVRDSGRAIKKAGKDAAKSVSRSVKELGRILGPSKKLAEEANKWSAAAAAAAEAADQAASESGGNKALADLTASADITKILMAETETLLTLEAGSLTDMLGKLSKPLSSLMKSRVRLSRDFAVSTLAQGEATVIETRDFIEKTKTAVHKLVTSDAKLPASTVLQKLASKAELVLASLVDREVDLAIALCGINDVG